MWTLRSRDLSRFLQNRLSFEVVAFLQAGLLAFHPVGRFLYHRVEVVGVTGEETGGVAFFAGGRCFPGATDGEFKVLKAAGGLAFPDRCGDGSLTPARHCPKHSAIAATPSPGGGKQVASSAEDF